MEKNNSFVRYIDTMRFSDLLKQIRVLPNLLSISRILFLPVVVYFIIRGDDTAAVVSMAVIWVTDFIDGYIARKFRQYTDLGLLLDPIADKITCAVVFLTLTIFRDFPCWVLLLIIGRDVLILSAGYYMVKRGRLPRSNNFGRITTVLLALIILLYLLSFKIIALSLCYVLIVMVAVTLFSYARSFCRIVKEIPPKTR